MRAGGAAPIVAVCRDAANAGLAGAEALVGIPGTIGGAVRMNAGTDVEIGDLVRSRRSGGGGRRSCRSFTRPEFAYRRSTLDRRAVVCAAELELSTRATRARSRKNCAGASTVAAPPNPSRLPNAGSIFRNPPGDYAARLIEAAGCKGMRHGGAQVSQKHANFIVNAGGARVHRRARAHRGSARKCSNCTASMLELEVQLL